MALSPCNPLLCGGSLMYDHVPRRRVPPQRHVTRLYFVPLIFGAALSQNGHAFTGSALTGGEGGPP